MEEILNELRKLKYENLYVNVVMFRNGTWGVCWKYDYLGSTNKSDAVRKRKEFLTYLQQATGCRGKQSIWKKHHLKTIKVI